ncbi:Zn-dependent hydrolase/oxidoreductase [Myriangium duriaei CBS 260.36]|uniref:Zn-dependent hydrolase/oxidoreductase n=1 Tax=Myriangium duriaei CBS 260.36 TaxID=1168546 RepID=A0A9P4J4T9_9PEZI|nr:Zn-dependent hydrolase/oxidoreductase [Myriangium duriaei CBS 260.36]
MSGPFTSPLLNAIVSASPASASSAPENAKDLTHHAKGGKGFVNPWESFLDRSAPAIIWAMIKRRFSGKGNSPDTTPPTVPVHKPSFLPTRETSKLRATWLGHACWLAEFPGGLRVLFDPVFTERCSPFSFMGPKRYTEMPCQIKDIPFIDAVVISHNHYDHLSHPTIKEIQRLHPNCHFFAPLGNKQWFDKSGVTNSTELDWWQSIRLTLTQASDKDSKSTSVSVGSEQTRTGDIEATIGCLPCQHMSARTPFDKSHTLWASWSVESGGQKLWFGGDTGYRSVPELPEGEDDYGEKHSKLPHCPAFAEIGKLRGPFNLGLIPIGAYDPRYIMSPMHANPFDSVNIFKDTRCKKALGMHWGTWVLTEEDVMEPPRLLKEAMKRKGLPERGMFDVCDIGDSLEFAGGD